MARVICIANQKGGVGKTTTSVNLAAALAKRGNRVLIVDMDPQGNASSGLGVKRYDTQDANSYHVLIGEKTISEAMEKTNLDNLFLIAANPDLVGAEIELVDMPQREYRLKNSLKEVQEDFEYVLIDCPPSLGLLTVNALSAADTFLVPLQCEYYALEGLSQLLNTAGIIKKNLNPELKIEGIVLTMFDKRNNLSHQVVTEIRDHFGDKVFNSIIPRNVRLSEAPSHGQSIFGYDDKSIGAKRYYELASELDIKVRRETSKNEYYKENEEQKTASEVGIETHEEPVSESFDVVSEIQGEQLDEVEQSFGNIQSGGAYSFEEENNDEPSEGGYMTGLEDSDDHLVSSTKEEFSLDKEDFSESINIENNEIFDELSTSPVGLSYQQDESFGEDSDHVELLLDEDFEEPNGSDLVLEDEFVFENPAKKPGDINV